MKLCFDKTFELFWCTQSGHLLAKKCFYQFIFLTLNIEKPFNLFSESKNLLELARDNKDSHFFLDEVHMSQNHVSSKVIAEISSLISQDNFFWVACQSDRLPIKTDSNLKGKIITICFIICHAFKCFIYQKMLCIVFEQINKMKLKFFFAPFFLWLCAGWFTLHCLRNREYFIIFPLTFT